MADSRPRGPCGWDMQGSHLRGAAWKWNRIGTPVGHGEEPTHAAEHRGRHVHTRTGESTRDVIMHVERRPVCVNFAQTSVFSVRGSRLVLLAPVAKGQQRRFPRIKSGACHSAAGDGSRDPLDLGFETHNLKVAGCACRVARPRWTHPTVYQSAIEKIR